MRKFHVFLGERYFVVHGAYGEIESDNNHLVFTYMDECDYIIECARFRIWDSYLEVIDGQDNSINPEAS